MLFSSVLKLVLEKFDGPNLDMASYLDDAILGASVTDLDRYHQMLDAEGPALGLHSQRAKELLVEAHHSEPPGLMELLSSQPAQDRQPSVTIQHTPAATPTAARASVKRSRQPSKSETSPVRARSRTETVDSPLGDELDSDSDDSEVGASAATCTATELLEGVVRTPTTDFMLLGSPIGDFRFVQKFCGEFTEKSTPLWRQCRNCRIHSCNSFCCRNV